MISPQGAQKLLAWFGGFGLPASLRYFTETLGIPLVLAWLAITAEVLGPLGLLSGLLTRAAALRVGATIAVSALPGAFRATRRACSCPAASS